MTPKRMNKKPKWVGSEADVWECYILPSLLAQGMSLRRLSIEHKLAPTSLQKAKNKRYPAAEQIIATAIGMLPHELWPSRYDGVEPKRYRKGYPYRRPKEWGPPGGGIPRKRTKL